MGGGGSRVQTWYKATRPSVSTHAYGAGIPNLPRNVRVCVDVPRGPRCQVRQCPASSALALITATFRTSSSRTEKHPPLLKCVLPSPQTPREVPRQKPPASRTRSYLRFLVSYICDCVISHDCTWKSGDCPTQRGCGCHCNFPAVPDPLTAFVFLLLIIAVLLFLCKPDRGTNMFERDRAV